MANSAHCGFQSPTKPPDADANADPVGEPKIFFAATPHRSV